MKNTCNGINNRLDIVKEKISEGKCMKIKIIQNKTRGKKEQKNTHKSRALMSWDQFPAI